MKLGLAAAVASAAAVAAASGADLLTCDCDAYALAPGPAATVGRCSNHSEFYSTGKKLGVVFSGSVPLNKPFAEKVSSEARKGCRPDWGGDNGCPQGVTMPSSTQTRDASSSVQVKLTMACAND